MASNSLANIQRTILVAGLMVLRQRAVMPRLVHTDYRVGGNSSEKGDVVNIPVPPTLGTSAVAPSNVLPAATAQTPTRVQITVDNWRKSDAFKLEDRDVSQLINPNEHFIPQNVDASVTALAEYINSVILADYTEFYGYVGTAGTTPFQGTSAIDASNARATLNKQKSPMDQRRMVIDPDAGAYAVINPQLSDFDKINTAETRITGELGERLGFGWYEDQQIPTHTVGTIAGTATRGALINNAAVTIGDETIDLDHTSLTGTIVVGDVFTVAGDSQTYVATATATAAANAISALAFAPPAKVAWADNALLTVKDSHVVNLAFQRNAMAFVSVPLTKDPLSKRTTQAVTDPVTGITLRLEHIDQYKQSYWEFDVLFGTKVIRKELGARVAG